MTTEQVLAEQIAQLTRELQESDALVARMKELLDGVAVAFRGPMDGVLHDWSQLPEMARERQTVIDETHRLLQRGLPLLRVGEPLTVAGRDLLCNLRDYLNTVTLEPF